jgi:hypothetical protein
MDLSTTPFLAQVEPQCSGSTDEESYKETTMQSPTYYIRKSRASYISPVVRMLTVVFAIWGVISIYLQLAELVHRDSSSSNSNAPDIYRPETLGALNLCDCGSTISEALSRNCIYDTLATAWLPPHCRDDDLTTEFERVGPGPDGSWPYFSDQDGKIPLNKSQISELGETNGVFWTTRQWHVAHCVFYWQKYLRMRDTGVVMERRFDQIAHVKHCGRLAMNEKHNNTLLIEVNVVMNSDIEHGDEP